VGHREDRGPLSGQRAIEGDKEPKRGQRAIEEQQVRAVEEQWVRAVEGTDGRSGNIGMKRAHRAKDRTESYKGY
jgi:hypothetical protein